MITLSNGLLLALAQNFAALFAGGSIRLFSGPPAASPSMAETGTLLGIVTVNGDGTGLQFAPYPAYVSNPPADRWQFTGLAAGNAGHFRLVAPDDTGGVSATQPRVDGTVDVALSGADMEWGSTFVNAGITYTLDSFVYIVHPIPRT